MKTSLPVAACVLMIVAVGCGQEVVELPTPGGPGSSRPALASIESEGLLMSWVESTDSTVSRLMYASFDGEEWSRTATIVASDDLFTNWADSQRLLRTGEGGMIGTWGVSSGASYLATDLVIGRIDSEGSREDGQVVHLDGTATQHGFASLVETDRGPMVVWLDGRETTPGEGVVDENEWGEMTLRAGLVHADGSVADGQLLDTRVCDCCPTAAVSTNTGALIAYRNRSTDEQRDIRLIRYDNGAFTEPYPLHEDGWVIKGCPVNGPALDSDGRRVVAAWFTAPNDRPMVLAAFSDDGGRTFSKPITVDDDGPHGRTGVVLLRDGSAAVSWIGRDERIRAIKVAKVSETGVLSTTVVARPLSPAFTGIPAIGRIDNSVYVVWTDGLHADSTRIQASRLEL